MLTSGGLSRANRRIGESLRDTQYRQEIYTAYNENHTARSGPLNFFVASKAPWLPPITGGSSATSAAFETNDIAS